MTENERAAVQENSLPLPMFLKWGRCARIYDDRRAAANVRDAFAQTILWIQDSLLPEGVWALMPQGRQAFAPADEIVVTHSGPTLDEVVVPLVTLLVKASTLDKSPVYI